MRVAVVGAGPAGLAAAHRLTQAGVSVDVFEAGSEPGGMARTLEMWGQRVDLGPHRFFSKDRRVNQLWLEVVGRDYAMVPRLTRIYYGGKFFKYPLEPIDALTCLGPREAALCLLSYSSGRLRAGNKGPPTFESFVTERFGARLFRTFFKGYSEKLWGIPATELDVDFAAQRIRKLSLASAVLHAFREKQGQVEQRTLADEFAYPAQGTGMVYRRLSDAICARGGRVHFRAPVAGVDGEGLRVKGLKLVDGQHLPFDHVVSSMPLTLLVSRLPQAPANVSSAASALTFRNTILVYLLVDGERLFPDNWLYLQSGDVKMGRITNFRNWVDTLTNSKRETILSCEYWCNDDDQLWTTSDRQLVELATAELAHTGLGRGKPVIDGKVVRVHRCYPVYRRGYRRHLEPIQDYLREYRGLSVIGRYGAFKYNNQDHSLLMGILAAENLTLGRQHDLFGVNTDYDEYQESSRITDTGLVEEIQPRRRGAREAAAGLALSPRQSSVG